MIPSRTTRAEKVSSVTYTNTGTRIQKEKGGSSYSRRQEKNGNKKVKRGERKERRTWDGGMSFSENDSSQSGDHHRIEKRSGLEEREREREWFEHWLGTLLAGMCIQFYSVSDSDANILCVFVLMLNIAVVILGIGVMIGKGGLIFKRFQESAVKGHSTQNGMMKSLEEEEAERTKEHAVELQMINHPLLLFPSLCFHPLPIAPSSPSRSSLSIDLLLLNGVHKCVKGKRERTREAKSGSDFDNHVAKQTQT